MSEQILHLKPKKWNEFQHYKDRLPPWIKLHRDLLNNKEFLRLPIASKALAPLLWLLASESKDGVFDASDDELVFRLRMDIKEIQSGLKCLIENEFFEIASGVLADCLQVATPEQRRAETETETETEKKTSVSPPEGVSIQVWADFIKYRKALKAPVTDTAIDGFKREAKKAGYSLEQAIRTSIENNWRGFKAEWVSNKTPVSNIMRGVI